MNTTIHSNKQFLEFLVKVYWLNTRCVLAERSSGQFLYKIQAAQRRLKLLFQLKREGTSLVNRKQFLHLFNELYYMFYIDIYTIHIHLFPCGILANARYRMS